MPARRIRVAPADALRDGFAAIRREAGAPAPFPADVLAEAEEAAARPLPDLERVDLPFVTVDPPGARDLDQALHIAPVAGGGGHRVSYAIADVGAFVAPGSALDREAFARGLTVYAPDGKVPLNPPVLSEGAASLLPGVWRPAVLWTLDLDAHGELGGIDVRRALVRSVAQHTYEDVPADVAGLLRAVGGARLERERLRGGVRLALPEQEVVEEDGSWTVRYRVPLETEEHNAQVSLLCGMAAAQVMLRGGVGILRTQPPPDVDALECLRREARALNVAWPHYMPYPEFIRSLNPAIGAHAALMHEAAGVGRGATYTAFDGAPPEGDDALHFAIAAPYAHATAPLRRLQDRFVSECCLALCAGGAVPDSVRAALPSLPAAMAAAAKRVRAVERGVVDLVESVILQPRVGDRFDAVVVDDSTIQIRDPAIRARLTTRCPPVGTELCVRLESADPTTRSVTFTVT